MAMTEPTVAPLPKCTSGMTATWWTTQGSAAMLRSWYLVTPQGKGACHAKRPDGVPYPSCYYRRIEADGTLGAVDAAAPQR